MSDIFDDYCKIMEKKGFVKEADKSEGLLKQDEKYKDKEWVEKIQALYNINPNDTDKSIIEQAHPNMMIIAPSYDKVNGLVENEEERHNIIVGLVNKMPGAGLTANKLASEELMNELVKLAFYFEDIDEDLSKKADLSAVLLSKELKKKAFWPVATKVLFSPVTWKVLGGALTLIGLKDIFIGNISEGISKDLDKAISEVSDLKSKTEGSDLGVVNSCLSNLNYMKSVLPDLLNSLKAGYSQEQIESIDSHQEAISAVKLSEEQLKILNKYGNYFSRMVPKLQDFAKVINDITLTDSTFSNEAWKTISKGWEFIAGSDKSEAVNSLNRLAESINKEVQRISKFNSSYASTISSGVETLQEEQNNKSNKIEPLEFESDEPSDSESSNLESEDSIIDGNELLKEYQNKFKGLLNL